jgi:hypothetical protein
LSAQFLSEAIDSSELPDLLNVVDLGGGKTGIIFGISGEDSGSLNLAEYSDGASLREMRSLHSIGAGVAAEEDEPFY